MSVIILPEKQRIRNSHYENVESDSTESNRTFEIWTERGEHPEKTTEVEGGSVNETDVDSETFERGLQMSDQFRIRKKVRRMRDSLEGRRVGR